MENLQRPDHLVTEAHKLTDNGCKSHLGHSNLSSMSSTRPRNILGALNNYFSFFFLKNSGAILWRVCYQRGLPRLFYCKEITMVVFMGHVKPLQVKVAET